MKLKCGKVLDDPALFLEVRKKKEAELFRTAATRFPIKKDADGLNQIDGIVVSVKDRDILPELDQESVTESSTRARSLNDRIRIIDPSLYIPFAGLKKDKEDFCRAVSWIPGLMEIVNQNATIESTTTKIEQNMLNIYPLLDVRAIQHFLEFQIKNRADIIVCPSVPLSSPRVMKEQIQKIRDMNRVGGSLFATLFKKVKDERDLMNLVALSPSVLMPEYFEEIASAITQGRPDMIGIRLMNLNEKDIDQVKQFFDFIRSLKAMKIPIFIFNVREFGYIAYCHGANAISMPIAKSPYTTMKKGGQRPEKWGNYYDPIDMTDYSYDGLRNKARPNNYRLPCHCEICDGSSLLKIDDVKEWNDSRKVHFMLVKDMETKELRETEVGLKDALKDKFGRSKKTGYVAFLD